jgi:hypothetical protein
MEARSEYPCPPTPIWAVLNFPFFTRAQTDDGKNVNDANAAAFLRKSLLFIVFD